MEQFLVMMLGVALILFGLTWIAVRAIGIWPILALLGLRAAARHERKEDARTEKLAKAIRSRGSQRRGFPIE